MIKDINLYAGGLVILVLSASLFACNETTTEKPAPLDVESVQYIVWDGPSPFPEPEPPCRHGGKRKLVGLALLLASPQDHNNCLVLTSGVARIKREMMAIFVSSEDYMDGEVRNSLWFAVSSFDWEEWRGVDGKWVTVEGRVFGDGKRPYGYGAFYPGKLVVADRAAVQFGQLASGSSR